VAYKKGETYLLCLLLKRSIVVWLFHWPTSHLFVRFVGAFPDLRKATTGFVVYVCPSVLPSA